MLFFFLKVVFGHEWVYFGHIFVSEMDEMVEDR